MSLDDTLDFADHTRLDDQDESNPSHAEGGTLFSQSDLTSVVHKIAVYDAAIKAAIDKERKLLSEISGDPDRTIGVEVQFRRYTLPASTETMPLPVMIVKEKPNRADTVITCFTPGSIVYIGLHSGISLMGMDTVAIVGSSDGSSRTIKAKRALYAIADGECVIDIQEEFA